MVTHPFMRACRENPGFKSSALIVSDFRNYWLPNGALEDTETNCGGLRSSF